MNQHIINKGISELVCATLQLVSNISNGSNGSKSFSNSKIFENALYWNMHQRKFWKNTFIIPVESLCGTVRTQRKVFSWTFYVPQITRKNPVTIIFFSFKKDQGSRFKKAKYFYFGTNRMNYVWSSEIIFSPEIYWDISRDTSPRPSVLSREVANVVGK